MKNGTLAAVILGVALAIGMIGGGSMIGRGLFAARASDRYVTVKGLAEREVPANLAMWPIVFSTTGNDLVPVQATLDASAKKIFAFLQARGFAPSDYGLSSPRVTDRDAQGGRMRGEAGDRYVAEQTVTLRSGKIGAVKEAMQRSGELIRQGVALVRRDEYTAPRVAAMLRGSHGVLRRGRLLPSGGVEPPLTCPIRNAQQGYFEIQDRDPFSPEIKKIRVVTTVQYFLEG